MSYLSYLQSVAPPYAFRGTGDNCGDAHIDEQTEHKTRDIKNFYLPIVRTFSSWVGRSLLVRGRKQLYR